MIDPPQIKPHVEPVKGNVIDQVLELLVTDQFDHGNDDHMELVAKAAKLSEDLRHSYRSVLDGADKTRSWAVASIQTIEGEMLQLQRSVRDAVVAFDPASQQVFVDRLRAVVGLGQRVDHECPNCECWASESILTQED